MTRRHLNNQQWFVLSWVADGCPDGVFDEGDHGHKISARALSNRGLITVRRRNGKWSAKLTNTGRFYLESGAASPENNGRPASGIRYTVNGWPLRTSRAVRQVPSTLKMAFCP